MTALQFVEMWRDSELRERQGSQMHFLMLCDLLGEPKPTDPESYCFERGAEKAGGGDGWADVWRKGCFAWEYKGKHANLGAALRQLQTYTLDLQMPPYLVVSDMERIVVHTNWNNTVSETHEWTLDDLLDAQKLDLLKQVFNGSERLKPNISPQELTAKAAQRFGDIGRRLQERKHDPRTVAHFLNRLIFCMFAEDAGLLPNKLFSRMMQAVEKQPDAAAAQMRDLFAKMHKGGFFGEHKIDWFNGGLFDGEDVLPLEVIDLKEIAKTADEHDWSEIDPAIFGTLFEQALKATRERPALGAHYTDREKILKIVDPVITRPLMAEWETAHAEIAAIMEEHNAAKAGERAVFDEAAEEMKRDPAKAKAGEAARRKKRADLLKVQTQTKRRARERLDEFLDRLASFRVLDPACGSGNFLYVALHALHDIERRAHGDVLRLGLEPPALRVSVKQLRGIEIERYAAELARVTLWIGDLQWLKKNGYLPDRRPILDSLDQIEERDALLDRSKGPAPKDWPEAQWPETDVIIGNPPFLGAKKMKGELGVPITERIRDVYDQLTGFTDFVCYWFEKARSALVEGRAARAGFLATSAIRGGTNQPVMHRIEEQLTVFEAWDEIPWIDSGKNVEASIVNICRAEGAGSISLNGVPVAHINSDLTSGVNVTRAEKLSENLDFAYLGIQKSGPLDITGTRARAWLQEPSNPNGQPNSVALRKYYNGDDVTDRPRDYWYIDIPLHLDENNAAQFASPFKHLAEAIYDPKENATETLKQARQRARDKHAREKWWQPYWPRTELRSKLVGLQRYLVTPETAEYRCFTLIDGRILPDKNLIVFPHWNFTTYGVLESQFHRVWALRAGTSLTDRPRYTQTTTFETFPFPEGLTPNIPASRYASDPRAFAIADAARELNEKREAWLNPPEWVERVPEVVPGYPDRIVPKDDEAAKKLKDRTLTKLYNERPAWLDHLHKRLDDAVAAAYGWPTDLSEEEILERLFKLNQERAAAGR
ncbi:MAG TPA: DNA methyltransferase [Vitreimonas sp.]|uniref:class I SAM-dependent DNA methyltransferase n=1 Tax=Vitreimonas sp. TaxID=3069702 RepID=UPI002D38B91A|nr:DNA methyltransferase [Vitreimonas sp.]HYD86279.1 DNA methyltransferase [Vitreimonas sp.]